MEIKIQANIQGFLGVPKSIYGVLDTKKGILVIAKMGSTLQPRQDDCLLISNDLKADDYDMYFDHIHEIREAIESYFMLLNTVASDGVTAKLLLSSKVKSISPATSLEQAGFDESGMKYNINNDINNYKVAVLAMCLYARRNITITEVIEMTGVLDKLMRGEWVEL